VKIRATYPAVVLFQNRWTKKLIGWRLSQVHLGNSY